jgi:hypothetical protein
VHNGPAGPVGIVDDSIPENYGATQQGIHDGIRNGTFTPFLGAGASTATPDLPWGQPLWQDAERRLAQLAKACPNQHLYVEEFARARRLNLQTGAPRHLDTLGKLQAAIIELVGTLTEMFGAGMALEKKPIGSLASYKTRTPANASRIPGLLLIVLEAAEGVATARPDSLDCVGIRTGLQALACQLLPQSWWTGPDGRDQLEKHRTLAGLLAQTSIFMRLHHEQPGEHIALEQLEWLSALLWYTLRYDVPTYLNSDELAFRISLDVPPAGLVRRWPLVEAALIYTGGNNLIAHVADWLRCYEAKVKVTDFHRDIAAALIVQFKGFDDRRSVPLGHVPVVLTTNYDRSIELALQELRSDYHVVFPVRDKDQKTVWLIRRVNSMRVEGRLGVVDSVNPDFLVVNGARLEPVGPIVVKLHGAPLESLDGEPYTHFLVLSETSYLEAISEPSNMPSWVQAQLGDPRVIWFFGYSLSDWNIRASLYRETYSVQNAVFRGAVSPVFTQAHAALLKRMNVVPHLGTFDQYAAMLECQPDVAAVLDGSFPGAQK